MTEGRSFYDDVVFLTLLNKQGFLTSVIDSSISSLGVSM
jgi:hypothetical protein